MTLMVKRGSVRDAFAVGDTSKGVALCGQENREKDDKLDDGHVVLMYAR